MSGPNGKGCGSSGPERNHPYGISVYELGNAYAAEFAELVHLAQAADFVAAEAIDKRFAELYKLLFVDGNPAGVKCLMELRGMLQDVLRLPLVPAKQTTRDRIASLL